ncbi:hypothetical protein V8C37DRAFT_378034, partial [Trichoderma ceciliae]
MVVVDGRWWMVDGEWQMADGRWSTRSREKELYIYIYIYPLVYSVQFVVNGLPSQDSSTTKTQGNEPPLLYTPILSALLNLRLSPPKVCLPASSKEDRIAHNPIRPALGSPPFFITVCLFRVHVMCVRPRLVFFFRLRNHARIRS